MHTFFINTSNSISALPGINRLFDNLIIRRKLEIINCKLGSIHEYAESISDLITRDKDIYELYNIIVYVEIEGRNEYALALEKATTLFIEEQLFSPLYSYGRKPNEALVLYGENFTRDAQYSYDSEYDKKIQEALWTMFPLPNGTRASEIVNALAAKYPKKTDESKYKSEACEALIREASEGFFLPADSRFAADIIAELVNRAKNKINTDTGLRAELYSAMENQKRFVRRPVTANEIKVAYVRLTDSDFNAENRSMYRILLFVYWCATEGKFLLVDPDNTGSNESAIPEINWEEFAKVLRDRKAVLEAKLEAIESKDDGFPKFNAHCLEEDAAHFKRGTVPTLDSLVDVTGGLTVAQLKKSSDDILSEISKKGEVNEEKVRDHITKITDNYNKEKERVLKSISYKQPNDKIENNELTRNYIAKMKAIYESQIVKHKRFFIEDMKFDDTLNKAKVRIDYFFGCLEKNILIYIFGVIFTLLFAVPYMVVQKGIFNVVHGWLFFAASVAAVVAIYTLSYRIFVRIYKSLIVKELKNLRDRFMQENKNISECIKEYHDLLYEHIPLSYCIRAYEVEFNKYSEYSRVVPEYRTYHIREMQSSLNYIDNLLGELDLTGIVKNYMPCSDSSSIHIDLDKDKAHNDSVYSLINDHSKIFIVVTCRNGGGQ